MSMIEQDWQMRLVSAIEASGRPMSVISREAGLGPNYVHQMIKYRKMPSADAVVRLCRVLRVSLTYIFTGIEMTADEQEILMRIVSLRPDQKQSLLAFVRSLQQQDDPTRE